MHAARVLAALATLLALALPAHAAGTALGPAAVEATPGFFDGGAHAEAAMAGIAAGNACRDSGAIAGCALLLAAHAPGAHPQAQLACWRMHDVQGGLSRTWADCGMAQPMDARAAPGEADGSAVHAAQVCAEAAAQAPCAGAALLDTEGTTCLDASQNVAALAMDLPRPCWKP
jgi:hypothetical protein